MASAPMMPMNRGRGNQQMMPNPALFNRAARLQRQNIGAVTYAAGVNSQYQQLPPVGYHFRTFTFFDLDATSAAAPTGTWLSGQFGGGINRFAAPLNILRGLRYTLNVSSPIYSTDGYGNYVIQLVNNRGMDPFVQVASGAVGRNRKERAVFCILNATTGAIVTPGSAIAAATDYKLRGCYLVPLTLGESASAGLVPVQDIRINPQLFMDFGDKTDLMTVTTDFASNFTGNFTNFVDYFTVPAPNIRPDTSYVLQTRQDIQQIAGAGDNSYKPQIGGVILRTIFTIWNNSQAVDVPTVGDLRLRIQQGVVLEELTPQIRIMDERRWYSKLLPDEVYVFDHLTGFGDPTLPSLRDRIASNTLTLLEYIVNWVGAVTATAEFRNYVMQLVPLPRVQ